jgi:hypothetical protein
MQENQTYHVLGLTSREQVALRALLFNSFAGWIDKTIREVVDSTEENAQNKASYTYKLFCKYNDIIDLLISEDSLGKAKPTFLLITADTMKLLNIAIRAFDEKNNLMGPKKTQQVKLCFMDLSKKILQSSQYLYTKAEIDLVKREK